jgi:NAD(P)H:quinone oxidoreductase type IV
METTLQIVFYSMYGHVYDMAEAVAEGARSVSDVNVTLYQVPELVPENILEKSGALKTRERFAHIPVITPQQLTEADAIIFGTPTRFGNMCSQMRNFLDQTGGLWAANKFVGKVGSVFASTGTQHGAGSKGDRPVSQNELNIAKFQGQHVAKITRDLKRGQDNNNKS